MPISDESNKIQYRTNGLIREFSFSFKFFQPSDLIVSFWAEGEEGVILEEGIGYEVIYTDEEEGGFIVLKESSAEEQAQGVPKYPATPKAGVLLIARIMPLDQQAHIRPVSGFPEEVITNTFDKLVMIDQQQQEQLDRCVKVAGVSEINPEALVEQVERIHESIEDITFVADNMSKVEYVYENGEAVLNASEETLANVNAAREQANIATAQAGISTTQANIATEQANIATAQAGISTTQANIATAQASVATEQKIIVEQLSQATNDIFLDVQSIERRVSQNLEVSKSYVQSASTQAGIATEQASIATTQADIATDSAYNSEISERASAASANNAEVWAEGTDEEVQALGGVHSSKVWAEIIGSGDIIPNLTNYVKNTDYATSSKHGIIKVDLATGINADGTGKAYIAKATDSLVTAKTNNYRPLTPSNIDLAVKTGITTNTIELTDEEKASAKDWLGIAESSGMPIGTIIPLNASSIYVPDGCLPCDGAEYTKAQFTDLWGNYIVLDVRDSYIDNPEADWGTPIQVGSATWEDITYGNNKYVAVNNNGESAYSTDGEAWTLTTISSMPLYSVVYGNGKFITVGKSGIKYESIDGITWSGYKQISAHDIYDITYANGKFVAVGGTSAVTGRIVYSTDGISWTGNNVAEAPLKGITYGNGKFIAVGDSGTIAYSTDGISWTTKTVGTYTWNKVAYGNGKFIVVGKYGIIAYSTDGTTWSTLTVNNHNWLDVTYGNGKFIAIGPNGSSSSIDGITWTTPDGLTNSQAIIYNNNKIIVVGSLGKIVSPQKTLVQEIDSNLCVCTYTEYESDLATYGQCGKFAVDVDGEKFRVPLIKNGAVIQQALTEEELGKSYNAGLPNITGDTPTLFGGVETDYPTTGAFRATRSSNRNYNTASGSDNGWVHVNLDASRSSSIYGNSDTVQPNAVALRYFVVVANGGINQSQMDWAEWASGLQGKANADLSNCTKPHIVEVSDKSLLPSWYRVYSDGWCEQGGSNIATNTTITLLKPYKDTNYTITTAQTFLEKTNSTAKSYIQCGIKTNSTFFIRASYNGTSYTDVADWQAKGFIS